jgi:hypothetical protein
MAFVYVPNGDYVIGLERRGEERRGEEKTATATATVIVARRCDLVPAACSPDQAAQRVVRCGGHGSGGWWWWSRRW